jgi:hypothetical protein
MRGILSSQASSNFNLVPSGVAGGDMIGLFRRSVESSYDELFGILRELRENQRKIMGDVAALNSAIASLNAAVASNTAAVADVSAVVSDLRTGTDQPLIDAATAAVVTATTQVVSNTASMEALKPAPAPEPAPAPAA